MCVARMHTMVGRMCDPDSIFRGPTGREFSSTSGCDWACTLIIHDYDAIRGDLAFRHFKRRRDGAIGKQPFSTYQRYRIYHQPESIDQIVPDKRLWEICAVPNVQIRPWLLLDFGDFFCNSSVQKHGRLPIARRHSI